MGNQILPILTERTTHDSRLQDFNVRYRTMAETCSRYNLTPMWVDKPIPNRPAVLWGSSQEWTEKYAHSIRAHIL